MNVRMDRSGLEPVLVVDRGHGEERFTMAEFRALAAGMPDAVQKRVEASAAGQEFAHVLIVGGLVPDTDPPG